MSETIMVTIKIELHSAHERVVSALKRIEKRNGRGGTTLPTLAAECGYKSITYVRQLVGDLELAKRVERDPRTHRAIKLCLVQPEREGWD